MNTSNSVVPNFTALSGMGLAVCSCGLSVSFGITLGHGLVLKLMFGLMLLSLAVAEFVAAFYLAKAWHSRQIIKILLAGYLLLGGITISVICGQATLQQSLDAAQQTRRLQSDVYQAAVAQRQIAAEKVAALSIDESQAVAARKALTALSTEKQAYLAKPATNSRGQNAGTIGVRVGDCTGTSYYVNKYCGKLSTLDSQLSDAKQTVDKWNQYQSAKAHLEELESKPLPTGVKDAQLPGINAIALMLKTDGEHVGAVIFFGFSVFSELAAIILFFFWGSEDNEGVSATPPYFVQQPQLKSQMENLPDTRPETLPETLPETHPERLPQNASQVDVPSVYQQIVDDIRTKKLRNGSFRTLMTQYQLNQNQAAAIRMKLVTEGKAKLNRRHELDWV
jgi:hypothetical protein